MFDKTVKSVEQVQQELKALKELAEQHYLEHKSSQDQHFQKINEAFQQLQEKQFYFTHEFEKYSSLLRDANAQFRKELESFTQFKQQLEQKITERMEKEFHEGIQKHFEKLHVEVEHLKAMQQDLQVLKEETQRLQGMSQKIKELDFQLPQYIKTLSSQEQEKARLSREIDHLQDLIAKMRQGRHS